MEIGCQRDAQRLFELGAGDLIGRYLDGGTQFFCAPSFYKKEEYQKQKAAHKDNLAKYMKAYFDGELSKEDLLNIFNK